MHAVALIAIWLAITSDAVLALTARTGVRVEPLFLLAMLVVILLSVRRRDPRASIVARAVNARGRHEGAMNGLRIAGTLMNTLLAAIPAGLAYALNRAMVAEGIHFSTSFTAGLKIAGIELGPVVFLLLGPFIEEYYFRELLYRDLRTFVIRPWAIIGINAVWFAAGHAAPAIPLALAVGVCCTALRHRTGHVALPILCHVLANVAADVAGLLAR